MIKTIAILGTLAMLAPSVALSQGAPQKVEGKIVCGSFSGDPKKHPAWQDTLEITMASAGEFIATPARPEGHKLTGTVAPSGAILIAGIGGPAGGAAEWTYEFTGKIAKKGLTVLKGRLADIKGGPAFRSCAISFEL